MKTLLCMGGSGFLGRELYSFVRHSDEAKDILESLKISRIILTGRKKRCPWPIENQKRSTIVSYAQYQLGINPLPVCNADYVIDMAESSHPEDHNLEFSDRNVRSNIAEEIGKSCLGYCFISSGAVYGYAKNFSHARQFDEGFNLQNRIPSADLSREAYAKKKIKDEQFLGEKISNFLNLRLFSVAPYLAHPERHFAIQNIMNQLALKKDVVVNNSQTYRSYIHSWNLFWIILDMLDTGVSGTFNIGGSEEHNLVKLANDLSRQHGLPSKVNPPSSSIFNYYVPNLDKIKSFRNGRYSSRLRFDLKRVCFA